jgi:hypothetical protein
VPVSVTSSAVCVTEDEEDSDHQADDQQDEPSDDAFAERDAGDAGGDPGRERVDGRAEHADAAAEQHDGRTRERVVPGGDHHGDDERVKGETLLGHPEGRPAEREDAHEHGNQPPLSAAHTFDEAADAGLDRAGLHRHAQEPADHEDEQRDVDRAEQRAGVVVVDVPARALDAVEAVDRRRQRVHEDPRRVRDDLVVRPRNRLAGGVQVVDAGRDHPCRDRRYDDQREEDRVRRREREATFVL